MVSMTSSLAERIASLALATFDSLPARCKPRISSDGTGKREWTPLSAIILRIEDDRTEEGDILKCVALGTGTKCLPASAIRKCHGKVLHDSHAEILAFRGLNCFLLREVMSLLQTRREGEERCVSSYLEWRDDLTCSSVCASTSTSTSATTSMPMDQGEEWGQMSPPFRLRSSVSIYLYSSTAPCGDASMELLIGSKSKEEAVPWSEEALQSDLDSGVPMGRGHFSLLGAVRRKPARGDAESTMSKSCTDKIALKQFTGLLAFPIDMFVERSRNIYLKGIVLYKEEYDQKGYERAFGEDGRLKGIGNGVDCHHFDVLLLPDETPRFKFDKQPEMKVTNLSALWVAGSGEVKDTQETLINGVKQGFKQFDERDGKASIVSRKSMLEKAITIQRLLRNRNHEFADSDPERNELCELYIYSDIKNSSSRSKRREIKDVFIKGVRGWVTNAIQDDFELKLPQ